MFSACFLKTISTPNSKLEKLLLLADFQLFTNVLIEMMESPMP